LQKLSLMVIMTEYMNETHKIKKYSAGKIVLLGLFALSLVIARLVIASRLAVVLSEPIKLGYSGLSISMPTGKAWKIVNKWEYQENAFVLSSYFMGGSEGVPLQAHCQYQLAAVKVESAVRFEQMASNGKGVIAKTGQNRTDNLTIDWAYIKEPGALKSMFFGTAQLPDGRQLDIAVFQAMGDAELAEKVFKGIVENVKFEGNELLKTGGEVVTKIKERGIKSFLSAKNQQVFFWIKNSVGQCVGFVMDMLVDSGSDAQLNIHASSFYYFSGPYGSQEVSFFQSDNRFDEFAWKSEISGLANRKGAEIIMGDNGMMVVTKLTAETEEKKYQLGIAAVPDVFLEPVFSQMIDSNDEKLIVDIIETDGKITPTLISKIEVEDAAGAKEDAVYSFKMEFLDGRGFSEQLYLDSQRQVSRGLLQQEDKYILERTDAENVLKQFPERAEYIQQMNKMWEQKLLQ